MSKVLGLQTRQKVMAMAGILISAYFILLINKVERSPLAPNLGNPSTYQNDDILQEAKEPVAMFPKLVLEVYPDSIVEMSLYLYDNPSDLSGWKHLEYLQRLEGFIVDSFMSAVEVILLTNNLQARASLFENLKFKVLNYFHENPSDFINISKSIVLLEKMISIQSDPQIAYLLVQGGMLTGETHRVYSHLESLLRDPQFSEWALDVKTKIDASASEKTMRSSVDLQQYKTDYLVRVNIGGIEARLLIDPGEAKSLLFSDFISAHSNKFESGASPSGRQAEVHGYWLKLGDYVVKNPSFNVGGEKRDYEGILGYDFLHQLNYSIDRNNQTLFLNGQ